MVSTSLNIQQNRMDVDAVCPGLKAPPPLSNFLKEGVTVHKLKR